MRLQDELLQRVANGQKFYVDLKKRKLKVGKTILIDDGVIKDGYEIDNIKDCLSAIENVFESYLYSRPSERSEANRHPYFKAKRYEELTDEQLIVGQPREVERARLESTVLMCILSGFTWKESYGSWYWKSKRFPELIILKEWMI